MRKSAKEILAIALLVVLVTMVVLLACPVMKPFPIMDTSSFLYVGQQILQGQVLYRDIWDHKGPVIFYINAVGLLLGGGSMWGVWALELAFVMAAAILGFVAMRRALGATAALIASVMWVLTFSAVMEYGNLTEVFGLPFQFLAFYLFVAALTDGWSFRRGFVFGVSGGLVFMLRQNLIGMHVAVVLFLVAEAAVTGGYQELRTRLARMSAGFAAIIGVFVVYFAARGALPGFWDCAFVYNFIYSAQEQQLANRLASLQFGIVECTLGVSIASLGTWIAIATAEGRDWRSILRGKTTEQRQKNPRRATEEESSASPSDVARRVGLLLLVALPLELHLATMSGRSYAHYFISWMPVMAIMVATGTNKLLGSRREVAVVITLIALISPVFTTPTLTVVTGSYDALTGNTPKQQAAWHRGMMGFIDSIKSRTTREDRVLCLGLGATVNFLADRRSSSRFFFSAPLYTPGYTTGKQVEEFLEDIKKNPPKFIVDYGPDEPNLEAWPTGDYTVHRFKTWQAPPEMQRVIEYLRDRYAFGSNAGDRWKVYVRSEDMGGRSLSQQDATQAAPATSRRR